MEPNMWGPIYWAFLFSTVLGYPLEPGIDIQSAYWRFFRLLDQVLPCNICRVNYAEHFREIPLNFYLYSRKALMEWLLILHNDINKSLGKSPLTLEEAINKYLGPKFIESTPYRECLDSDDKLMNAVITAAERALGGADEIIGGAGINQKSKDKNIKGTNKNNKQTVGYKTGIQTNTKAEMKTKAIVEGFNLSQQPYDSTLQNIIVIILLLVAVYFLIRHFRT